MILVLYYIIYLLYYFMLYIIIYIYIIYIYIMHIYIEYYVYHILISTSPMYVGGFIRESSNVTWFLSEYRVDSGSLQRKHGESSISPAITINWMNIRPTFAVAVAQKKLSIIEMFSRFLISSKFQGTINQFQGIKEQQGTINQFQSDSKFQGTINQFQSDSKFQGTINQFQSDSKFQGTINQPVPKWFEIPRNHQSTSSKVIRNSKEPSTSSTFTSCAMLATAPTWRAAWNAGSAARAVGDPGAFHAMARPGALEPLEPHGFADHYPVLKNGYFIGKINPRFSGWNPIGSSWSCFFPILFMEFSWNPQFFGGIFWNHGPKYDDPDGRPSSKVVSLASFPWPCREVVWDMWLGECWESSWRGGGGTTGMGMLLRWSVSLW